MLSHSNLISELRRSRDLLLPSTWLDDGGGGGGGIGNVAAFFTDVEHHAHVFNYLQINECPNRVKVKGEIILEN